jgi:hypothetical protein
VIATARRAYAQKISPLGERATTAFKAVAILSGLRHSATRRAGRENLVSLKIQ